MYMHVHVHAYNRYIHVYTIGLKLRSLQKTTFLPSLLPPFQGYRGLSFFKLIN